MRHRRNKTRGAWNIFFDWRFIALRLLGIELLHGRLISLIGRICWQYNFAIREL